jgi:cytochrome c biogenesis protein CcdA
MPYEIAYSGSDKVVLQRRSFKSAMIFIIFIGSVFAIAGLALIFLMSNVEPPFSYIRFLFAGMGILVVLLGINYPKMTKVRIPESITFDNRKGLIEIEQDAAVSQKGFIAYKDIDRFDVYEEYHSGSHSGKTQSRSYYTYHVLLRKKDGGEWFLREWRSRPDAEKMIAELSKVIDVNAPSVSIPKAPLPDKLNREFQGSKTMLSWRNKLGFAPFIFGGVVLFIGTVFYIIGGAVFSQMADMIIPVSFVLGFIGLIFIGIVFVQVRKMIKNATTTFRISIDKNYFRIR